MNSLKEIGTRLKQLRENLAWSKDFAVKLINIRSCTNDQIDVKTLDDIENGVFAMGAMLMNTLSIIYLCPTKIIVSDEKEKFTTYLSVRKPYAELHGIENDEQALCSIVELHQLILNQMEMDEIAKKVEGG